MSEHVRGWDEPSWLTVAGAALRDARTQPAAANRNPSPQAIVVKARLNGPLDVDDDVKHIRIEAEAKRAMGVLVHLRVEQPATRARTMLSAPTLIEAYGQTIISQLLAWFERVLIDLDRELDNSPDTDIEARVADLVSYGLDERLARERFHHHLSKELTARVRADRLSTDDRRMALQWFQRLREVPEQSAEVWLDDILRRARHEAEAGRLKDPRLHEQLIEALATCGELSWPGHLDAGSLASRASDKIIDSFVWRDRLDQHPIDRPVVAWVGRVRRTVVADEYADHRRVTRADPTTLGLITSGLDETGSAAVADWLDLLAVLEADTIEVPTRLAKGWVEIDSTHHKARPSSLAVLETAAQITSRLSIHLDSAIGGAADGSQHMADFLGGLRRAGAKRSGNNGARDSSASWIANDVLVALAERHPEWRLRYAHREPSSRSPLPGAFETATELGDYRRYLRLRSGNESEARSSFGSRGVGGTMIDLYPLTVDELQTMEAER